MGQQILIPNTSKHDVASFSIMVDGKEINPVYQVLSLVIIKEINRIPTVKILIRDGEASEKKFSISNTGDFIPGKKIEIKIGRDGKNNNVFKGIVVKHGVKIKENGNPELMIECKDEAVRMTIGRHSRYYEKMKDNQVFDEIIGNYKGLKSDSEITKLKHKELIQHHISDWDFMLLRAEANGMLVLVEDGTIKVKKPVTTGSPALQVSYGSSILEFEAEIDARQQYKNVAASSWDYANQQLFKADTSSVDFAEHGNIKGDELAGTVNLEKYEMHHSGYLLEQELQDWVDGAILRSRLAKIRGRAKFTGFSAIKIGDLIKIDGIGDRFNGNAVVTAVKHEIGNGSWDTHVQFGLDTTSYAHTYNDISDPQTAALVGGIHGLQIGKVVQLENDPNGQHRILVKIPVIDNDAQGVWTRIASLDAGSNRGAFFRPEINDEVIVGFINDDPRNGVVLGMLHSSAKAAPIEAKDINDEKGFVTRSEMKLLFDDGKKSITISTPKGNTIILDESESKITMKDQSNNKIVMEPSGITMESPKNIEINAGANLTLKATAQFKITGATVSAKADGNISVEGAVAKLSAQGAAEISGAMVKIN